MRFTYFNATLGKEVEIPYYIVNFTTNSSARVWTKVPFIPENSTTTIYMYYGNPSATSTSNRTEVCPGGLHNDVEDNKKCWLFYEDFSTDVFTQSEW